MGLVLRKVACEVICDELDAEGNVVGEFVAAQGTFFPTQLDAIPERIAEIVRLANEQRDQADGTAAFDENHCSKETA